MEPFTLDRNFLQQDVIDGFTSLVWKEKYYGDGDVELVVPATSEMIAKLPEGIFLGIDGSEEVMILETANVEEKKLKLTGTSLLKWLNNRFVRASAAHEDRYFNLAALTAGQTLWVLLYYMTNPASPYLDGTIDTGIDDPTVLAIPNLGLLGYDSTGPTISVGVPYGPLYDAMREIATTFKLGMRITLEYATSVSYSLGFRTYKGVDRTSDQTDRPVVQFSPQMDSLTNIKELRSIAIFKTWVAAFAPANPGGLVTVPGFANLSAFTGFDLRAQQVFAEDITTDQIGADPAVLVDILDSRASDALTNNSYVSAVDGEIVAGNQFKYGQHYNLGDIVEMQGYSGILSTARVTEYIRTQDATGEKAYPTLEKVG